jgi:hypothetical protein
VRHDTNRRSPRGSRADGSLRAGLQRLIDERGLAAAAKDLFVSASTLARVVAGAAVLDGTAELFRSRLSELEEDAANVLPRSPTRPASRLRLMKRPGSSGV